MATALSVATALTFVWLGMVLAISFLEAPLKFRAPEITIRRGLGIGRLVFRALNAVEGVLVVGAVVALVAAGLPGRPAVALGVAVLALLVQVVGGRPRLTRRSDAVLALPDGEEGPRSHAHYAYVGLEIVKVVALAWAGVGLLLTLAA
ncbi:hypothetical protein GCM10025865_24480 [Paraoerskovia sediminicola]|uniref:DUF4149 domain-containing protein n=1 Tax=Paraoerskovia sediminicola TaxID=1138587 RepID=A0ABM8G4Z3_9CELL|nr:hypothetical protein [Paraoerskovia sediminicola]BDZ43149.1 hypothetical protein GCM10025865_24480 [Paraoerskovia sediminicola]